MFNDRPLGIRKNRHLDGNNVASIYKDETGVKWLYREMIMDIQHQDRW
jgi:hypothetical protein